MSKFILQDKDYLNGPLLHGSLKAYFDRIPVW